MIKTNGTRWIDMLSLCGHLRLLFELDTAFFALLTGKQFDLPDMMDKLNVPHR